jgi:hypothetical protein
MEAGRVDNIFVINVADAYKYKNPRRSPTCHFPFSSAILPTVVGDLLEHHYTQTITRITRCYRYQQKTNGKI